jgi:hypothetical protein
MRCPVKTSIMLLAVLTLLSLRAYGQAAPAGVSNEPAYNPGPALPLMDSSFQYSLTGAEIVQFGGYSGQSGRTYLSNLSGTLEYISPKRDRPFTLLYSGGLLYSTYSAQGISTFQTLTAAQGFVVGRWSFGFSDSVSYLPESPTTGLSGIAGVGDQGLQVVPDPNVPVQTILTNYGRRLSNSLNGNIERNLNGRTSLSGGGNYGTLHFFSGNGVSSTQISGQLALNRRLDRRSSLSVSGVYSTYTFADNSSSFQSRGVNLGYNRQVTKELSVEASAGPQWVSGFQAFPLSSGPTVITNIPSRLNLAASVGLSFTHQHYNSSLNYSRGVNSGSGVQIGSLADSISGQLQRHWGRSWGTSITGAYTRSSGLVQAGTTSTFYAGGQVSRNIAKNFSVYLSYTATHQSIPSILSNQGAFNGSSQSLAAGITFSPRSVRLNRF